MVTERYMRLGLNPKTGTKVKQRLIEANLIAQEKIGVPDGSVVLLKLTERGKSVIEDLGINPASLSRNASPEHEYWKDLIARRYKKKGYRIKASSICIYRIAWRRIAS